MPHFTFRERTRFLSFLVQALVTLSRGFSFGYGLPPLGLIGFSVHPITVVHGDLEPLLLTFDFDPDHAICK